MTERQEIGQQIGQIEGLIDAFHTTGHPQDRDALMSAIDRLIEQRDNLLLITRATDRDHLHELALHKKFAADLQLANDTLLTERDAAVMDAERYRWLREHVRDGNVWQAVNRAEIFDDRVDAAIAAAKA